MTDRPKLRDYGHGYNLSIYKWSLSVTNFVFVFRILRRPTNIRPCSTAKTLAVDKIRIKAPTFFDAPKMSKRNFLCLYKYRYDDYRTHEKTIRYAFEATLRTNKEGPIFCNLFYFCREHKLLDISYPLIFFLKI